MRRLYTRTGDDGTTGLPGGVRVSKLHPRIEANGALDELNVAVGKARSFLPVAHPFQEPLREIQLRLMTLMSRVATPSESIGNNPNKLPESLIPDMEALIDRFAAQASEARNFILPGGTPAVSALHEARVLARRAERRLWEVKESDALEDEILVYVNRLSDLFFIMARVELENSGLTEEVWQSFSYNRVKK